MTARVRQDNLTAQEVQTAARKYRAEAVEGLLSDAQTFGLDRPRPEATTDAFALTDDEPPYQPDFHNLIRYLEDYLEAARVRMVAADKAHQAEVDDDLRRRARKDLAKQEAYSTLVTVRGVLKNALGEKGVIEVLGVAGTTPQGVPSLLEALDHAITRLEQANTASLPPIRMPGMAMTWEELLQSLRDVYTELVESVRDVREDGRATDLTLRRREAAKLKFRHVYVGCARVLDGLLTAASMGDLALKVRPTVARRPGSEEDGEGELPLPDEPLPVPEEPLPFPLPPLPVCSASHRRQRGP